MKDWTKLFAIISIITLGIIDYSNSFHCSFHFDDSISIFDNPCIRNIFDFQRIWDFWPSRFVTYLFIAFNYHFNHLDVFGYHLFNLAVHVGAAVLFWWLTLLTLSTPAMKENGITRHGNLIALFAGLIFVSHPIQTQAVTYIIQRAASLAALFYLASLCFYVKSRLLLSIGRTQGPPLRNFYYICSLMTAILAMFSKETAITLPLMILLYEFYFFNNDRDAIKSIYAKYVLPFFILVFIIPLIISLTGTGTLRFQELQKEPGISSMHYLLTQFRVMATYIRLVFFPLNQNLDYDYPIFKSIFEIPVLASLLFLISILFLAKRLFLKYRLVSFSICWFFLTLLPESSFIPIKDVIYEHRLYLPLVGCSLFLVSGAYYILGKNSIKTMVMVLLLIIVCNSYLTYQRNKVWTDEIVLWGDVIQKSPHKSRPYINRGKAYIDQGKLTQGMNDFNKALELEPNNASVFLNRGWGYLQLHKFDEAMADLNKSIALDPNSPAAYIDRGVIYEAHGKLIKALIEYSKAIIINPYQSEAYNYRGNIYKKLGNLPDSVSDFTKALEINPDYKEAYNNRAIAYSLLKERDKDPKEGER